MPPHHQVNSMPAAVLFSTAALALAALSLFVRLSGTDGLLPVALGLGFVLALNALFSKMSVSVTERGVDWSFRGGWYKGHVPIREITEAEIRYKSWIAGYGDRWTPSGRLLRAWGLDVVQIHRKGKKPLFLGASDPAAMVRAIEAAQAKWLEDTDGAA
jgi:hypothetical protein